MKKALIILFLAFAALLGVQCGGDGENSLSSSDSSSRSGSSDSGSSFSSGIGIASHVMVLIPAGTFLMGSPVAEANHGSDETPHPVTLTKDFYMAKYQVTQELYQTVMGVNPGYFSTINNREPAEGEAAARRPVETVRWYDALVFCNKLSGLEGLTPVYTINGSTDPSAWGTVPASSSTAWNAVTMNISANGYRLPTEAEWEFACRAGTTTAYNLGDVWSGDWGWYSGNSNDQTHETGKKTPNAWGIYDMHGNVWEWCWDRYGSGYYTDAAAGTDPAGPGTGIIVRVLRGGGFSFPAQGSRSAFRFSENPSFRSDSVGFRVARTVL
ncbi:MAG: formylglycine-generating enzyme family protein [Spirochaetota bacterium]|jgi:formylglycine-generating enzyme required for sulfatase activity|nr:formylglycine-generating enzyme family protein [Spirochaetota bacterium]